MTQTTHRNPKNGEHRYTAEVPCPNPHEVQRSWTQKGGDRARNRHELLGPRQTKKWRNPEAECGSCSWLRCGWDTNVDVPSSCSQKPLFSLRAGPPLLRGLRHRRREQVAEVPGGVSGNWVEEAWGGEVCGGGVELRRHDWVQDGWTVPRFGGVNGGERVGGGLDGVAQQSEAEEARVPAVVGVFDADHCGRGEGDVQSRYSLVTAMDSQLDFQGLSWGRLRFSVLLPCI